MNTVIECVNTYVCCKTSIKPNAYFIVIKCVRTYNFHARENTIQYYMHCIDIYRKKIQRYCSLLPFIYFLNTPLYYNSMPKPDEHLYCPYKVTL